MEVRDGFIVGIYNYCDSWCQVCAFTSRCGVFADIAEMEASRDTNFGAVVCAPRLPDEIPLPPPRWMQELIDEVNEAARNPPSEAEWELIRPRIAPGHQPIEDRAHVYCVQAHAWLRAHESGRRDDPGHPYAVIGWYHTQIPAKIHRALIGLSDRFQDHTGFAPDYDGSAKVALMGIERSHAACIDAVAGGLVSDRDMRPLISDLVWLKVQVEHVFPNARRFIRAGFDEPEEVAKLSAALD